MGFEADGAAFCLPFVGGIQVGDKSTNSRTIAQLTEAINRVISDKSIGLGYI
jgi:hypothetical protein